MHHPPVHDCLWQLPPGRALRVAAAPIERRVAVIRGRLWLTREGDPADHWLGAGEGLSLAPGESAVIEAWPEASFQLLLAAVPAARAPQRPALCWLPSNLRPHHP